eukprot:s238_g19.t1
MANSNMVDAKLPRKQNQDWLALLNYIPLSIWESLDSDDRMVALEKLCAHTIKLGLQHPTEVTQGLLLAMVFDRPGKLLEAERWRITEQYKSPMKKLFDRASDPPVYLLALPWDPKELPRLLWDRAFYQGEEPVMSPRAKAIVEIGKAWPMRTTHSSAASSRDGRSQDTQNLVTKQDLWAFGSMVVGAVHREEKDRQDLPGLQILKPAASHGASSAPLLAIADLPANTSKEMQPAAEGTGCQPVEMGKTGEPTSELVPASSGLALSSVEASLHALREQSRGKKSKEAPEKSGKAKAKLSKKPAAVLKRPAGKKRSIQVASGSSSAQPSQREVRRMTILALVPEEEKKKYKQGCTSCRYTAYCTPSCWIKRGYGEDL